MKVLIELPEISKSDHQELVDVLMESIVYYFNHLSLKDKRKIRISLIKKEVEISMPKKFYSLQAEFINHS